MKQNKKSFEYYLIFLLFTLLIITSFLQVLFRFILNLPLAWTEELSRYVFIALIYTGACSAAANDKHVRVELIDNMLPARHRWISDVVMRMVCAVFSIIIALHANPVIRNAYSSQQKSASLQLPMWMVYLTVPVMFLLIALRFIQAALQCYRKREVRR